MADLRSLLHINDDSDIGVPILHTQPATLALATLREALFQLRCSVDGLPNRYIMYCTRPG